MVSGRISLLIDSPLRDMLILIRNVPNEAAKQAMKHARAAAAPIWKEETAGRAMTRTQQRVLVDSARVGVTGRNVFLRAGATGRLSSGTPVADLKTAAEFGMNPGQKGSTQFGPRARRGKVFFPAAREASARVTSVVIQAFSRALYDALEGKR